MRSKPVSRARNPVIFLAPFLSLPPLLTEPYNESSSLPLARLPPEVGAHRPLPLAHVHQRLLVVVHRRRAEEAIARVAQTRDEIPLGREGLVDVSERDAHVGMVTQELGEAGPGGYHGEDVDFGHSPLKERRIGEMEIGKMKR